MCNYYGITLSDCDFSYESMEGDIEDRETGERLSFEIDYLRAQECKLTIYEFGVKSELYLTYGFDPDCFTGNFQLYGDYGSDELNIFDLETENETETANSVNSVGDERFAISLGILASRLIKFAVIAAVVIVCATFPTYIADSVQSLADNVSQGFSVICEKIKYLFIDWDAKKDKINSILEDYFYRGQHENREYYITIPIRNKNVDFYRKTFSDIERGDMLISTYPVSLKTAKLFLRKGYSIYTFYPTDAYYGLRYAWRDGYVKEESCESGFEEGHYSHYHAYFIGGKRGGYINGIHEDVHGFYGIPWKGKDGQQ